MVTRDVVVVADVGGHFAILVSPALPDENFVDVQPIFVCSFDSDEIEESWATNEIVPALSVTIVENPSPGDVEATNQQGFLFPVSNHAFQSVPGLNLLLRAGSGCYSPSGSPCSAWPGNSLVSGWFDESSGPARNSQQGRAVKHLQALSASPWPSLIRFPSTFDNNKQTSILAAGFYLEHQLLASTPPLQRPLWSASGWTLFLCFSPITANQVPQSDRDLVRIADATGSCFRFLIDTDPARGAVPNRSIVEIRDGSGSLFGLSMDALNYRTFPGPLIVCVRVDTHVRVWMNGIPAMLSAYPLPAGMTQSVDYTVSSWFTGISNPVVASSSSIRAAWGAQGCANLVASYNRPLTLDETNTVNKTISDLFRAGTGTIAFY
jgi:hypothetical protein